MDTQKPEMRKYRNCPRTTFEYGNIRTVVEAINLRDLGTILIIILYIGLIKKGPHLWSKFSTN